MEMLSWIYNIMVVASVYIELTKSQQIECQLLGLLTLSGCSKGMEADCKRALTNQESILKVHQQKRFWFKMNLCFKDMKNDSKVLTDTLLPLVVNEHYTNVNCENVGGVYKQSGHMTLVFTYLTFDLTRLVSSLILPLNSFNLVSVPDRPMYPSYFLDRPLSIYSFEAGFKVNIHEDLVKIKTNSI